MKAKKILAVLMMFLILAGALVGCGDSAGSQNPGGGSQADEDLMDPWSPYPETVVITTARSYDPKHKWGPEQSMEHNLLTDMIKEQLNVEYQILWQVESTEFLNKLSLNLAAGDIPDTFTIHGVNDYLFYRELVDNGMLADLSEAYDKCAGEYMSEVFDTYEGRNLEPYYEGDALYAIASGQYGYGHSLLWVRKDWLDQVGLDVPMTIEEIEEVLRAFVDQNVGGNNLGFSLDAVNPIGRYASGFTGNAIFYALHAYPNQWLRDDEGNVYWGTIAPEVKDGLEILARWYQEGLIDKQFMTRTNSGEKEALISSGQTGIWFGWWGFPWSMGDLYKTDPDLELVAVQAPLDADGNYSHLWPAPAAQAVVVSKDCANPEAVIKTINVEFNIWRGFDAENKKILDDFDPDGLYDQNWDNMFPTGGFNLEYNNIIPSVGQLAKDMIEAGTADVPGHPHNTQHDRNMAQSAMEYAQGIKPDGWADYYTRYIGSNVAAESGTIIYNEFPFSTESMADLKPNLDKLTNETFLKIIVGELPVDYFDEFVEQWKAQGGDVLTQEVQAMLDR